MSHSTDSSSEALAHKNNLIQAYRNRLYILEERSANMGMSTPPEIVTEIEQLKRNIVQTELELAALRKGTNQNFPHPITTPIIGHKPKALTEEDVKKFLQEYPEWKTIETPDTAAYTGVRQELYRFYEFPTFELALQFMNEVSKKDILRLHHHPRWQNAYTRVEIWLTTFNLAYRLSTKDRRLAESIEKTWEEFIPTFLPKFSEPPPTQESD
jgi:pterin-4a-carbinolamine dehydratase